MLQENTINANESITNAYLIGVNLV